MQIVAGAFSSAFSSAFNVAQVTATSFNITAVCTFISPVAAQIV